MNSEAEELLRHWPGINERCDFDHHGYCQTHLWFDEPPCIARRVRAYLGLEPL